MNRHVLLPLNEVNNPVICRSLRLYVTILYGCKVELSSGLGYCSCETESRFLVFVVFRPKEHD